MNESTPELPAVPPGGARALRAELAGAFERARRLAASQARAGAALDTLRSRLRASLAFAEGRAPQREPWAAPGAGRGVNTLAAGSAPEST